MNTARTCLLLVAFFPLLAIGGGKKNNSTDSSGPGHSSPFRVIGYLPDAGDLIQAAGTLDFGKLTHLNIAFVNPDSTGVFAPQTSLQAVVSLAHASGVKVLISIGGGNAPAYLKTLISAAHQAQLTDALLNYTLQYGLDGVDVDLEGSFIDADYESFVSRLAAALVPQGRLITAAVATAYANSYTDKALSQFSFINIMSYDRTGPWNPGNPGQHAPLSMAVDDLTYWGGSRGIPQTKLNLGLPFYGYGFGVNAPQSISYQDIISQYPDAWNTDQVTVPGGGIIYYNGGATIKAKTTLALQHTGGVMIWQLLQDAAGPYSLLKGIDSVIHSYK